MVTTVTMHVVVSTSLIQKKNYWEVSWIFSMLSSLAYHKNQTSCAQKINLSPCMTPGTDSPGCRATDYVCHVVNKVWQYICMCYCSGILWWDKATGYWEHPCIEWAEILHSVQTKSKMYPDMNTITQPRPVSTLNSSSPHSSTVDSIQQQQPLSVLILRSLSTQSIWYPAK